MGPAVQMMTGAPYYDIEHKDVTVDELWEYIHERIQDNWMITVASQIGTGSDKDQNALGIPYRHALSVLDTKLISNGLRLIKVRNPWAAETYHGPWSDKSDLWTDQIKYEAGYEDIDDGVWFISVEDYHENMWFTSASPDVMDDH